MQEVGLDENAGGKVRVPVHEDFLFDVDIELRELCPVYWLGPIYEVRRGYWFFQEGSTLRPCDENLATQLEEGYLKVKPFRYPKAPEKPYTSKASGDPKSLALSSAFGSRSRAGSGEVTPKASMENLRLANQQALEDAANGSKDAPAPSPHQPQTHRLFGIYMNSIVTYQDSTVAWLSVDSIMSRVSSTVYQKFAGGGYLGGVKLVRGYSEPGKSRDLLSDKMPSTPTSVAIRPSNLPSALQLDERQQKLLKRRSAPPSIRSDLPEPEPEPDEGPSLSSLTGDIDKDMEAEAEAVRKRDEKEIQNDYNDSDGENQGREIDHLLLVTHGIGQRLGMRYAEQIYLHEHQTLTSSTGQRASISYTTLMSFAKHSRVYIQARPISKLSIPRSTSFRRTVVFRFCPSAGAISWTFRGWGSARIDESMILVTSSWTMKSIQVWRTSPSKECHLSARSSRT